MWRRAIKKPDLLNASKIAGENNTAKILALPGIFVDFNTGPKVPFPGVLDIGQFHSPQMKPCKLADYFTKVRFHILVNMRQGESKIFQIFNLESIFFITKNICIKKNPTNFSKRVETGVDPCLPNCPLGESPTTSHCQVECWHV